MSIGSWFASLPAPVKILSVAAVGFGVYTIAKPANATPGQTPPPGGSPGTPGGTPGAEAPLGDDFARLPTGARVRLPESWSLRARPLAAVAATDRAQSGGAVVEIVSPATGAGTTRGPREKMYQVVLIDGAGNRVAGDAGRGYAFVPYNATRVR